jgi:diketogulonate reductase-like aldo/keto reductase
MDFPLIGFSTHFFYTQGAVNDSLKITFDNNYKMFDCSESYNNQNLIGNYLQKNINRKDIWITTKIAHNTKDTIKCIYKTFNDLQTDYIDLYLLHTIDLLTWNYLRKLQKQNKIRYIGLSNFSYIKLKEFIELIGLSEAKYIFCNQIEFNPYYNRRDLIELCKINNIIVVAYLVWLNNNLSKYVKWCLLQNIHVIPIFKNLDQMIQKIDLNIELTDNELNNFNNNKLNYKIRSINYLYNKYIEIPNIGAIITKNTDLDKIFANNIKMIDCTCAYRKKTIMIGNYLKKNKINRNEIWMTASSTLTNKTYRQQNPINLTFSYLQTGYIDLFLVYDKFMWSSAFELYSEGKVRYIGVINFDLKILINFMKSIGTQSRYIFCNKINFNPEGTGLVEFCKDHFIHIIYDNVLYIK